MGTNLMLKAELHRLKNQLAALQGHDPSGLGPALATSLAFSDQPNTAAAEAAQVRVTKFSATVSDGSET